jgi:DNA anti-recombination protein RmuC
MESTVIPPALRDRLGPEATAGLLELLAQLHPAWKTDVIEAVTDRFERRLVEETSKLRIEMSQGFAVLRHETSELRQELAGMRHDMAQGLAGVRHDMAQALAGVRQDMTQGLAGVRQNMAQELAGVRQDMAQELMGVRQDVAQQLAGMRQDMTRDLAGMRQAMTLDRFELLKWAFLFWVGQFFATASLAVLLVRFLKSGG